jgi:hypothetical protein
MTPPHVPGHESDDIVDMTPAQEGADADLDELVESTPQTRPADDSAGLADAVSPEAFDGAEADSHAADIERLEDHQAHDGAVDAEDAAATWDPFDDMPEYFEPEQADDAADERPAQNGSPPAAKPPTVSRPRPAKSTSQAAPAPLKERLPQMLRRHWKLGAVALAASIVVALAVRALAPLAGSVGVTQRAQATSTATAEPAQIGNQPVPSAIGPLLLLNPGVVKQGNQVTVTASGFDPGSAVDIIITRQGSSTALATTHAKADKNGMVITNITAPTSLSAGTFVVTAQQVNSKNKAQGIGTVAGGSPYVKLSKQVGQPGTVITITLHGFAPRETINVFWNTMSGQPVTTFTTDGGGGLGQATLRVPFGAVGDNTFLFVGKSSQSLAATDFLVLSLYPTVKLTTYALQADHVLSYTGKGFGPSERVLVFINSANTSPIAVIQTDENGGFKNAPGFVVPFALKGKQTLIFMGEQSRAPNAVNFTVLPYAPQVQPSTYGGFPGTTITFFGTGFARNEVVHVYAGHTKSTMGTMISCFKADDKGNAAAVGSYLIPGDTQGTLGFALVGAQSGGVGVASVNITTPPVPVHTPDQKPFTCPLDSPSQQAPAP